ncbi:MAG: SGNH/GDSL hydrolase family protein [Cyclobacteriaceae bacterium]
MKNPTINPLRRSFMKKSLLSGIGLTGLMTSYAEPLKKIKLPDSLSVVFQGDSITDAGRSKESERANDFNNMGRGYAMLACAELVGGFPRTSWQLYNRGISGNKVPQLDARWQKDCLDMQPDVVSILIGVNDYWHTFTHDYKGTPSSYEKDFDALLTRTKNDRPGVKLIIGEPFALKEGSAIKKIEKWYPEFYEYQKAAKSVSDKHGAAWIPYQKIFDEACDTTSYAHWSGDGVHPSFAGAHLMAKSWMEAFGSLYK